MPSAPGLMQGRLTFTKIGAEAKKLQQEREQDDFLRHKQAVEVQQAASKAEKKNRECKQNAERQKNWHIREKQKKADKPKHVLQLVSAQQIILL
jgi:hypothetical protein